ncbi:GSU3473 family protein [Geotalea uraniireducens]|uniref:GSU3473 family protein n=1 Tax=Geotalea uraniireducens TaxID=351604 RepID=UPI00059CD5B3
MLIRVIYRDASVDLVNSSSLAHLIKKQEIVAFCRSDGWIMIDRDPVRKRKRQFVGPGRRATDLASDYYG